jgi:hypothetical protein
MHRLALVALLLGTASSQQAAPTPAALAAPAVQYEYAYLLPGGTPKWVEPGRSLEGYDAICTAMLAAPASCTWNLPLLNALGAQGWFPVSGLIADPRTGLVYFFRVRR